MKKTILVVDDSVTVRQQMRIFFTNNGYDVIEAADGALGLEQARGNPVDLMIVDFNMPNMNGLEMIEEVRKLPTHPKTPIFVLTTASSRSLAARGKTVGATAWIVKPFKPEIVLQGVKKVLGS